MIYSQFGFPKKAKNTFSSFRCLVLLIEKEESRLQYNSKLISRTIPEIVMCFDRRGKKEKENVALVLLLKVAQFYQVKSNIEISFIE